jgi:hypothetical protein
MRKQAYTVFALLVLVGSMALAAQAQTGGSRQLIANIPFNFNVGTRTLPAGEYIVMQVNVASDRAILQFRSKDGTARILIQTSPLIGKAEESTRLVFNRYGANYFFAQAWIDGSSNGSQAPKPRAERDVERQLAGTKPKAETVALTTRH